MPTYEYVCTDCGSDLEAVQSFSAPSLTDCPTCGGKLRKRFGAVGVVFKGSGFYRNDSRSDGRNGSGERKSDSGDTAGKAEKSSESSDSKVKAETKSEGSAKSSESKSSESKSSSDRGSSSGGSNSSGSNSSGSNSSAPKASSAA